MKRNKSNCFQVDYLLEKVSLRFTFLLYCCYELLLPTYGVADSDSSPSIHYHGYLWSVQIQPSDLFLLGRDSIRLIQLPYLQQSPPNETRFERQTGRKQEYTDADFAREMQGLSFQERQQVTEDVHLASGQVQETEEFLNAKVKELIDVIDNHSKKRVQRDAWDRAVFLRPALAKDRDHHLMFLRAKNNDAYDAAMQLFKFYETKRRLWGDELLARRIGWDDLSKGARAVHELHSCISLPRNRESPSRQVRYYRSSVVDTNVDPLDYVRAMMYSFLCHIFGNEEIHREGQIVISDLRGPFKMSTCQYLDNGRTTIPMLESIPGRIVAVHLLVEKSAMIGFVRSLHAILTRNNRLRVRIHTGSWMEIQYSLRSFGIDIASDWLEGDVDGSPFSSESIRQVSEEYRRNEEEWKRAEAPLCDPASDIALYPNPQDVIMGKNRIVALSWPGNLGYTAFMRQHAARYGAASTKPEKMEVATKALEEFKTQHRARFLTRLEDIGWEVIPYREARLKVSQSLRDEYRKMSTKVSVS